MESQALRSAVRRLRRVVYPHAVASGDAELIRAFATREDGVAFEQIVRRHGPMVMGVCRRVLRDPADVDDAFQATFLVLVRKASSLRAPDRLAGWLHQVAHRVAMKARAVRLNRARREGELFEVSAGEAPAEVVWRELRPIFDDELDRLPDRLRLPAVLCLLEGRSKREAAEALGWAEGTLSCRLHRARERLRSRLSARGLTLSAGALAAALFEGAGTAAVPDRLIASTLQGVCTPAAAAGARALANGVTQAMFLSKVKILVTGVLLAGMVGTGTGVGLMPGTEPGVAVSGEPARSGPPREAAPVPREAPQADPKALADAIEKARQNLVIANLRIKQEMVRTEVAARELQELRRRRLDALRAKAEQWRPLVAKGTLPLRELEQLQDEIKKAEAEQKLAMQSADPNLDRAVKEQELELLKDRVKFEEQMVKKGFMTEAQLKLSRLKLAQAEADLTKPDAPKPDEARRAAADELIRKLEQIVEQTRKGVERGIVPEQELLNSQATLARYKFEVLATDRRPAAPSVSAEQRAAMEAIIQKLEEIVARTEEGVKRGIVPEKELLNAQVKLLEYKFKLVELAGPTAKDPRPAGAKAIAPGPAVLDAQEQAVERALKAATQNTISQQEVRKLKIDLARTRAEVASARGDLAAATKHREAVVCELETQLTATRAMIERSGAARSELRAAEVALAEARVDALRAAVRQQLAAIVALREEDLREARARYEAKVGSASEVRQAEVGLAEAKARLAATNQ